MTERKDKKRLLLINPVSEHRRGFAQDLTAKHPPLGLAIIAAHTPSNWKIRILDENFQPFRYRDANLIGITSFTPSAPRAYAIAREFRDKGIPVIMGGVHASMCPEEALQHVDSVVIGEAESIWPQVIADAERGTLKRIYRGDMQEMNGQPVPRHDLLHPRYVFHSIQTSRGCPMNCDFCTVTAFNGNQYRLRPVKEVLDELELFRDSGRALFFVDDNIVGYGKHHLERAKELFRGMIDRDLKLNWFSQASINIADDEELLHLAAKSGCRLLLIGIEAETDKGLKSANKSLNLKRGPDSYRSVFRKINRHGIGVLGTFIFGLETDSPEDLLKRSRYILSSGVDCVQASVLTPLPGTTLMTRIREQNRLERGNFPEDWQCYHFTGLTFRHPFIPAGDFDTIMQSIWTKMYSPARIIRLFFRTWWRTGRLTTALWAYQSNLHYRHIVFEKSSETQ